MAIPDWNQDIQGGKRVADPKWSPCSPTQLSIDKQAKARHIDAGATIADSSDSATYVPKS